VKPQEPVFSARGMIVLMKLVLNDVTACCPKRSAHVDDEIEIASYFSLCCKGGHIQRAQAAALLGTVS